MTPFRERAPGAERIILESCRRERRRLILSFRVDQRRFRKVYHYRDTDLFHLEARYGEEFLQRIYFHIMAMEAFPLASFRPRVLDPGPFGRFRTAAFENLWRTVFRKAGAQWRYENGLPRYAGPDIAEAPAPFSPAPLTLEHGPVEALAFCGGGKDSLLALKLLEQGGVSFASYHYSHSCYGPSSGQERLTGQVLDLTGAVCRHGLDIEDSLDRAGTSGLLGEYGARSLLCAETPISVFGALPVVLQHCYRYIVVGHERSADSHNLVWSRTGEPINHNWGKSSEAESLIDGYIRTHLISNLTYCSVLQPVYDVVIFNMLRPHQRAVAATHSCNIRKPWCGACAKCAYVGLSFMAYLPGDTVGRIFPENILDQPSNQPIFRQLLGLESHKPFECVGEIGEARLAMEICARRGTPGRAVRMYRGEAYPREIAADLGRYLSTASSAMPPALERRILPLLRTGASNARDYIARFI